MHNRTPLSMSSNIKIAHIFVSLACIMATSPLANGQLTSTFYSSTCPNLESIVAAATQQAISNETRMAASLLRLHFHDCFVNGCDGSILLDNTASISSEKNALPNANSVRGFEVIDTIKTLVESNCSGVVSCADILTLAARDAVVAAGGRTWTVPLGRRDSLTANQSGANSDLPPPTADLATLISMFQAKGLSAQDMTALSGAHTIGFARCVSFRNRIYNDTNINATFAATLQANCPSTNGTGDDNLAAFDAQTPAAFDVAYYQNLMTQQGLLHSDQELFNNGTQDALVTTYSSDSSTFFTDFAAAMVNMGNISPLTGTAGEIRSNCRVVNS